MKKLLLSCLLILLTTQVSAESMQTLSLPVIGPRHIGLGSENIDLNQNQQYVFNCKLTPKNFPSEGSIFLRIKLCPSDHPRSCPGAPLALSKRYDNITAENPNVSFRFVPQQTYFGKQTHFSTLLQFVPATDHRPPYTGYDLDCNYDTVQKILASWKPT